jgi:hypothetical protein
VIGVYQNGRPKFGNDFLMYFQKLMQAEALRKALGG